MTKTYTILNCVCEGVIIKEQEKLINRRIKGSIGAISAGDMKITNYYCGSCGIVYKASIVEQRIKELTGPF